MSELRFPKPKREATKPARIKRGKRPPKVRKTTPGKMARECDRLFSLIIRHAGVCRYHINTPCKGPLQCAHIVSRRYRTVRWHEGNAMPLCAGAHRYFTDRPLEWERFVRDYLPGDTFSALKEQALQVWDKDIAFVLARLKARAAELGIK